MENRAGFIKKMETGLLRMVKALLAAYVITGIFLVILALLLYKFNLEESKIVWGITAGYIVSVFVGGFLAGKMAGVKKYLWGIAAGALYFLLLFVISWGLYHSFPEAGGRMAGTFLLCICGGMLGGMLS